MKEDISALIDGEATPLERERILRAMQSDSSLRETWERYHLLQAIMRREFEMLASPGLAERIERCLREEAPDTHAGWTRRPLLLKFTAGLAIAASVATVAILNLSPLQSPSAPPQARNAPAGQGNAAVADARPNSKQSAQQRALNPYLVHHGEFAPAPGMNGMLSYVRVVGHDGGSTAAGGNGSE